ncbi:putative basic amino acid antiporter YfcC [Exilibacterium tricleocarpae]|uniref:Putative basic amino acid antiporter YfcC n=2 Tax=Exilibacterium tricleocarpae TaxID=2591008 RepID=A0A545TVX8_9GAMM|nr:putative basic amino acid antiporter YfcC [Exilibacterium tricleocarpae]
MPDTYVILFFVALLAFALTHLLPAGRFNVEAVVYTSAGESVSRTVVDPASFRYLADGDSRGLPLFAEGGGIGLLNFVFEGLVSGSKWGAAIGVMAFILITGGAFGIILKTGVVEQALLKLIARGGGDGKYLVPALFFVFSLCGAVFGMSEEAIAFTLLVVPVMVAIGYDSITAVLVTYVATQIGFSTSWMNPFGVAIAQGIAGVPLLSGAGFRIGVWSLFTCVGMLYVMGYAARIKRHPQHSLAYVSDAEFRRRSPAPIAGAALGPAHWLILLTVAGGVGWIVWGVAYKSYYLPEIASQFFTMGLVVALIAVAFRLNGFTANDAAAGFREGAQQLLPAALVVGIAKGIVLMLGGDDPEVPSVLNTVLHHVGALVGELPNWLAAWGMYLFQSVFNFFIVSGSGQAALTMPLMAPLSDLVGLSRQTAVLAFQLGDGLTNIFVPTSAALMGCLGAARLDWVIWLKFIYKFMLLLVAMASVCVIGAVVVAY